METFLSLLYPLIFILSFSRKEKHHQNDLPIHLNVFLWECMHVYVSICIIYDVSMLVSLIPVQSYRLPSFHVANLVFKSEKHGSHFFFQCFYSSIQSWDTLRVVSDLLSHITSRKKRKIKEWERKKQREI